jgi:hypothetical protein
LVDAGGSAKGYMIFNINPFMISIKILQITADIESRFPLARIRVDAYKATLIDKVKLLLDELYLPRIVKM